MLFLLSRAARPVEIHSRGFLPSCNRFYLSNRISFSPLFGGWFLAAIPLLLEPGYGYIGRKNMKKSFLFECGFFAVFLIALEVCFPLSAHAGYLDPGSGSILVQSIISVLAFWGRLTAKIKNIFRSKKDA